MAPPAEQRPLTDVVWVHVFERDTAAGAVFMREDADIPLSRRPRERLVLHADGSAIMLRAGPDDRFVESPARWSRDGDDIVVRAGTAETLRIIEQSADRLLVRMK
jgi:hypothetical protein